MKIALKLKYCIGVYNMHLSSSENRRGRELGRKVHCWNTTRVRTDKIRG